MWLYVPAIAVFAYWLGVAYTYTSLDAGPSKRYGTILGCMLIFCYVAFLVAILDFFVGWKF